ncbi:MAG: DUF1638 domain-containing protein [Bacilli bacterium]|nr:DUF1638 domain-containing protein [Bacilli bacterium]
MKVKILSCQIFEVYLDFLLKEYTPRFDFDIEYFEIDQHNQPKQLNHLLQEKINRTLGYDLIILIYGICGNATTGITASSTKIVIPRVHDCSTILLGNKAIHHKVFHHRPSQGWSCISYTQSDTHQTPYEVNPKYLEFREKYDEDTSLYLFNMLYPTPESKLYISLDLEQDHERISNLPKETEIIQGSFAYLMNILQLQFDDMLVLNPNETIVPIYDNEKVMTKK